MKTILYPFYAVKQARICNDVHGLYGRAFRFWLCGVLGAIFLFFILAAISNLVLYGEQSGPKEVLATCIIMYAIVGWWRLELEWKMKLDHFWD